MLLYFVIYAALSQIWCCQKLRIFGVNLFNLKSWRCKTNDSLQDWHSIQSWSQFQWCELIRLRTIHWVLRRTWQPVWLLPRQLTTAAAKWLQIPSLLSQDGWGGEGPWSAEDLLKTEQVIQEGLYEHHQWQWRSPAGDHHSDNCRTSRPGPQEGGPAVQQ